MEPPAPMETSALPQLQDSQEVISMAKGSTLGLSTPQSVERVHSQVPDSHSFIRMSAKPPKSVVDKDGNGDESKSP